MPTSFDVTNAMASCGTSDSALSEMDSSSITMPDVISGEDVFKEVQQLSGMTDAWILKCEDLRYSPSHTEIQSKLTAGKKTSISQDIPALASVLGYDSSSQNAS